MRRLLCILALSAGTLVACGGTSQMDEQDALGSQEQGLSCPIKGDCPVGTVCDRVHNLCMAECPATGFCISGRTPCLSQPNGPRYCPNI